VAFLGSNGMVVRVLDTDLRPSGEVEAPAALEAPGRRGERFVALAAHADAGLLALACTGGVVRVYDARAAGRPVQELRGHGDDVLSLAFAADGRQLATAGKDGVVKVWDPGTGLELLTLPKEDFRGTPQAVAFSPDGRWLAVGVGKTVYLYGSQGD
jgi:WD40 repeat protein